MSFHECKMRIFKEAFHALDSWSALLVFVLLKQVKNDIEKRKLSYLLSVRFANTVNANASMHLKTSKLFICPSSLPQWAIDPFASAFFIGKNFVPKSVHVLYYIIVECTSKTFFFFSFILDDVYWAFQCLSNACQM